MIWSHPQLLCRVMKARSKTHFIRVTDLLSWKGHLLVLIKETEGETVWVEPRRLLPVHQKGCPKQYSCACGAEKYED